jgi:hypothetical protein
MANFSWALKMWVGLACLTAGGGLAGGAASASTENGFVCRTGTGRLCVASEIADPVRYRQILVFPTGYLASEESVFWADFEQMIVQMARAGQEVYSGKYRDQILYFGHFIAGGSLGTPESLFRGRISSHPIRGKALTVRQNEVYAVTEELKVITQVEPIGVALIFNTMERVTANASPPTFIDRTYGVARMTRGDLGGPYIASHELAHAALNFVDEYIEAGFQGMNISILNLLSPMAIFNGTWAGFKTGMSDLFGVFNWKISEILAANGTDNVDITSSPSRVVTEGYEPNAYEFEGGMFFGRGTYHDTGENLMNSVAQPVPGNGFGWAHSESQWSVLKQVFEQPARAFRPNDRIRNAGPWNGWPFEMGKKGAVFLFDADKEHRWHPTQSYEVQVGWHERRWEKCYAGKLPYPCLKKEWVTVQKSVRPERIEVDLPSSRLAGTLRVVQKVACALGVKRIPVGGEKFDLCTMTIDEVADAFLPTLRFPAPYQTVEIPMEQLFTTFYWRFRTVNGSWESGWTGWSKISRSF